MKIQLGNHFENHPESSKASCWNDSSQDRTYVICVMKNRQRVSQGEAGMIKLQQSGGGGGKTHCHPAINVGSSESGHPEKISL